MVMDFVPNSWGYGTPSKWPFYGLFMGATNHLLTGMILQVGCGFIFLEHASALLGGNDPILTSIFFKWIETNNSPIPLPQPPFSASSRLSFFGLVIVLPLCDSPQAPSPPKNSIHEWLKFIYPPPGNDHIVSLGKRKIIDLNVP